MASLAPSPSSQPSKPQRVLACVRCQQRKIRCDRKFPCAHCTTSRVQCIPATVTPRGQRRRRFPERELLERLRKYEDLLRQNNIKFEPLHKDTAAEKAYPGTQGGDESDDEQPEAVGASVPSPAATVKSDGAYEAKNYLSALNLGFRDGDDDDSDSFSDNDFREKVIKRGWDHLFANNDHLLFGSPTTNVDLSTLHPEPVQIFRLWQIYLDNVNSLLKVTHTPSLQGKVIEAASDVKNIDPALEALMFSIYCMAIRSLAIDDCQVIFGSSAEDLTTRFQFGCQQALLNCGFLRSDDRNCLTALTLYLISLAQSIVPRALSAMLGIAIRIAQRLGYDSESALAKCSALEAELRRRLWWALVLYDTRIGDLADHKSIRCTTLTPTWDCKIPLNVSDFDLRPETKEFPEASAKPTEALFAVVRGELGEFIRNTIFYLDFTFPALKPIIKNVQMGPLRDGSELAALEKMIEEKYLKFCDLENPLHFMTIWTTRSFLAKHYLLEHYSKISSLSEPLTEKQRDTPTFYAINTIECDTKLMTSPLTKGFRWQIQLYFPFPAYLHLVQELKIRPISGPAEQAWAVMSDNFAARFSFLCQDNNPFFKIFGKLLLQIWDARELALRELGESVALPKIVSSIRDTISQFGGQEQRTPRSDGMGVGIDDFPISMPAQFNNNTYNLGKQANYTEMGLGQIPGQLSPDAPDVDNLDWSAMNWNSTNEPSGQGPYPYMAGPPLTPDMNYLNLSGRFSFPGWPPGR